MDLTKLEVSPSSRPWLDRVLDFALVRPQYDNVSLPFNESSINHFGRIARALERPE